MYNIIDGDSSEDEIFSTFSLFQKSEVEIADRSDHRPPTINRNTKYAVNMQLGGNQERSFSGKFDNNFGDDLFSNASMMVPTVPINTLREQNLNIQANVNIVSGSENTVSNSVASASVGPEVNLNDDLEIDNFIINQQSKRTKYKEKTDMNKFLNYLKSIGLNNSPENMSKYELDTALCKFFINVRKNNGELLEPDTVTSYRDSIQRYLESKKCSFNIKRDAEFCRSRTVLEKRRKELTRLGKGNKPNACRPLDDDEMDIMYGKSGSFGICNPQQLQRTVWWKVTVHFGYRGRDESARLEWGDVKLTTDAVSGRKMLLWDVERGSKTRQGAPQGHLRRFPPKALETGGPRCPVMIYEEYKRRRPESMCKDESPFFLGYTRKWKESDPIWFGEFKLGKNPIGEFMSKSPAVVQNFIGRDRKLANHTARKTEITRLLDADTPPVFVSQLSGHKRPESLGSYYKASMKQQRRMSDILSAGDENSTSTTFYQSQSQQRTFASASTSSTATKPDQHSVVCNVSPGSSSKLSKQTNPAYSTSRSSMTMSVNSPSTVSSLNRPIQHQHVTDPGTAFRLFGNPSSNTFNNCTIQIFGGGQADGVVEVPRKRRYIIESDDECDN